MVAALIFYTLLYVALLVVPAGFILVVLVVLDHARRDSQGLSRVFGPVGAMIAQTTIILGLRKRFPLTAGFLGRRLERTDSWGLHTTVAGLFILLGLWFFFGVLEDIAAKDPLVIIDVRLHNAVPLFRTVGMTWFMLTLTALGSATGLSLVSLGVALLALASGQRRLAATFALGLVGTSLISITLKELFRFERPTDGMISALESSFPSEHLLSGAVIYGLLAALLLRSGPRRGLRAIGTTLLLLVIVGIGLSRLYLGVHWPSDLLGSLALALIVLVFMLFFLYYDRPIRWADSFPVPLGKRAFSIAGACVLAIAVGATAILASEVKIVLIGPPPATHPFDIQALRTSLPSDLSRWSEDLMGGRMEPISLVFVGGEEALLNAFSQAGWARADLPTPVRVVAEAVAAFRNFPDPTAPATPAFFADRPQTFTFEKPDASSPSIRRRHHTRVWQTQYCIAPECRPIWVATASYDVGVRLSPRLYLPTHRIDPAVDSERARIVAELTAVGAKLEGNVLVTKSLRGTNAAGDPFWTDGRAAVLVLQ